MLQYACAGTPPGHFANFVNKVGEESGATVTVLFDRTQWDQEDTSAYGIDSKLKWYKAVRSILVGTYNNHYSLAGVSFDIEGLSSQHYLSLMDYSNSQWKELVPRDPWAHETIGFNLGSEEGTTAAKVASKDIVDRIYWENYRNTESELYDFANGMLEQISPNAEGEVVLAVNTICCSNPCVNQDTCSGTACKVPGTHIFQQRTDRSFCRVNNRPGGGKMNVNYMLDSLDSLKGRLHSKYKKVLRNLSFYVYDYRAFKILLEGRDTIHATTCPAPAAFPVQ